MGYMTQKKSDLRLRFSLCSPHKMQKIKHELTQLLKLNSILASSLATYNSAFQMALKEHLHTVASWYAP